VNSLPFPTECVEYLGLMDGTRTCRDILAALEAESCAVKRKTVAASKTIFKSALGIVFVLFIQ
jgi:hypothetical protein